MEYCSYYMKIFGLHRNGLKAVPSDFKYKRKSDTCFLLASGTSVLNLKTSDLDEIRKHDSFSINYFLLHDFVPDFYYLEIDHRKVSFFRETLDHVLGKNKFSRTVLLINNEGVDLSFMAQTIKDYPLLDVYITCYRRLSGGDSYLLSRRIRSSLKLGGSNLLIHQGGSVAYLIFLSIYLGYKNIVVVGADGFTPGHFYLNNVASATPLAARVRDFVESTYTGNVNPSVDLSISSAHKKSIGSFTMLEIASALYSARDVLESKYDVNLFWFSPGLAKTTFSDFFAEYNFSSL